MFTHRLFCEDFGFFNSCGDYLIQRLIPQLATLERYDLAILSDTAWFGGQSLHAKPLANNPFIVLAVDSEPLSERIYDGIL